VRIQVGITAPVAGAHQRLYLVEEPAKMPLLLDLLGRGKGRVLVFARTKRKVDRLTRLVAAHRHRVARLHGDRPQSQRDAAMAGFREGRYRILIATDIAARGIDVADIEHVINYDFPRCAEDYIHRIGRTARMSAHGRATSFVTHTDRPCLTQLERLVPVNLSPVTVAPPERGAAPAAWGADPRGKSAGFRAPRKTARARRARPRS